MWMDVKPTLTKLRLNQAASYRVFHRIGNALEVKFQHHAGTVPLYSSDTYAELFGDDLIGLAFCDEGKNLLFSGRQGLVHRSESWLSGLEFLLVHKIF